MARRGRRLAGAAIAAMTAVMIAGPISTPAHADRCEPEELVFGANTSPINERDSPVCVVLINYVYPFICADFSTLQNCTRSLRLNPGYQPPLVPPYSPSVGRIYCNLYRFVFPAAYCSSTADADTSSVQIDTSAGALTLRMTPLN